MSSVSVAWRSVWNWYVRQLTRRPLLVQATSTGLICGAGDVIAQQAIERRGRGHDWERTAKLTFIGFVFTGPALRTWFASLDKIVGPSQNAKAVIKKVFLDQGVFAPVFFACLLPLFGLSQGMDKSQIRSKMETEYFNMLFASYKLWPAVQMINFYLIPLKFRVNFANLVAVAWNTYISSLAYR